MYPSANYPQHLYLREHRRDRERFYVVSIIGLVLTVMGLCVAAESECNVDCIACFTYVNPIKSEDWPSLFMTERGPGIGQDICIVNG